MSQITEVYFDANVLSHIVNRHIRKNTYDQLRQCIIQHKISAYYTPIAFNEIAIGMIAKDPSKFTFFTRVMQLTKELCGNNIYESPDPIIRHVVLGKYYKIPGTAHILNHYRDLICGCKSYKALAQAEWFNEFKHLAREHLHAKKEWCRIVNNAMRKIITVHDNPSSREKRRRIPPETREGFRATLRDRKTRKQMVDMTILKVIPVPEEALIGETDDDIVRRIETALQAYYAAYQAICEKAVENNYRVRESDYDDIHSLVYLSKGKHIVFATQDGKLRENIRNCEQAKQVFSLAEMCAYYCQVTTA